MDSLDLKTVRDLVLDSTDSFKDSVAIEDADVVERMGVDGEPTLFIRLRAEPEKSSRDWPQTRLRIAQRIRDDLLALGDARYPILSVYSQNEWQDRDR